MYSADGVGGHWRNVSIEAMVKLMILVHARDCVECLVALVETDAVNDENGEDFCRYPPKGSFQW